ncbi:hypothetical protein FB451DRAFT_1393485 [Mycena latifolia]|nr:hypothetical protein FB451DRAFT_1393485 [Mycena latifolia]
MQVHQAPLDHAIHKRLFLASATKRNNGGKLITGGGLWFGAEQQENVSLRMAEDKPQSALSAEATAAFVGVQGIPRDMTIELISSRKAVRVAMTGRLQAMEDKGWIGIADRKALSALAAVLKSRSAPTFFKEKERRDSGPELEGHTGAAQLARQGCHRPEPTNIDYVIEPELQLRGAKLSTLTQATAYAGIKERKADVTRKASENNVKQVALATQHVFKRFPTTAQVWKSIRHKDFTRQTKNFFWKSLHSAHRIGTFWQHIPDCEDRGICQFCKEPEDLDHILLRCKRPGQSQIWALAKELWLRKHPIWPEPSLGSVLGCGLANFTDDKGRDLPGTSRLYRILVSESIFTIWKIRNESVIARSGDALPVNMIHNKWFHTINQCLLFDRILTNHAKYGKQNSIKTSLVLQTWSSTLMNEEDLPENWIKEPRVLVGTEPQSSHPAPQPSGRRGRGR